MGFWTDYLDEAQRRGIVGSRASYSPRRARDQYDWRRTPVFSWGDFGGGGGGGSTTTRSTQSTKPTFPERLEVTIPFQRPKAIALSETPKPPTNPLESLVGNVNIANVIPWLMERQNVLAHEAAKAFDQVPVLGPATDVVAAGSDAFIAGVRQVSEMAAPVLDAIPSAIRDQQLKDRTNLYHAIVHGRDAAPGSFLGSASKGNYDMWRHLLLTSADPEQRMQAQRQIQLIADSIDLPESVKGQLRQSPNLDFNTGTGLLDAFSPELDRIFSEAPEGRQWSYEAGALGIAKNLAYPLLSYGGTGLGALRGAASGSALLTGGTIARGASGSLQTAGLASRLGRAGGALTTGVAAARRATTVAAQLQKYALISGASITGLSTAYTAVASAMGNEEALAWFDRINRTHPISDSPQVQLVTGFTVNPFAAAGALKKGVIKMKYGSDIVIGKALGGRLGKLYDSDEAVYGILAKMYRLPNAAAAKEFAHGTNEAGTPYYADKGEVFNEVMDAASQVVIDRIPLDEATVFAATHADGIERTRQFVAQHAEQIERVIREEPDLIAQKINERGWEYTQLPGTFSTDVAALIAKDYRLAKGISYELRNELDAVVGMRDHMTPQGAAFARGWLDRVAKDGQVNVRGRDGLQDLVRAVRPLRQHWQGVIPRGAKTVTRDVAETMIQRAEAEYAAVAKHNPVRAATGSDPIIRPDRPDLEGQYADALGTDRATVKAILDGDNSALDRVRAFVAQKVDGLDETTAAALTPDDVWAKAYDYIDRTASPWIKAGEGLAAAEKSARGLRGQLARLNAESPAKRRANRPVIQRLERELDKVLRIMDDATDPIVPFSRDVAFASGAKRRATRIQRMNPDKLTQAETSFLRQFLEDHGVLGGRSASGRELWERAMEESQAITGEPKALDPHMMELAERKLDAQERLRTLQSVDEELAAAGLDDVTLGLVVTDADGELAWVFDVLDAPPPQLVDAFIGFKTSTPIFRRQTSRGSYVSKRKEVSLNQAAQQWDELAEAPPRHQWSAIADSPGFVKHLRDRGEQVFGARTVGDIVEEGLTGNALADIVEAAGLSRGLTGQSLDNVAAAMGVERAAALQRLADLKAARERALADTRVSRLRRTAEISVPEEYLAHAESERVAREVFYDPEYEVAHGANIAKLIAITDSPDELWPALRGLADSDPAIREGLARVAARINPDELAMPRLRAANARYQAAVDEFVAQGERPLELPKRGGGKLLVTIDPRYEDGSRWRVTFLDADGTPTGHLEADSFRAAVLDAARSTDAPPFRFTEPARNAPGTVDDILDSPQYAGMVRQELVPEGFEPPTGVVEPVTDLDQMLVAGDVEGVRALSEEAIQGGYRPSEAIRTTEVVARRVATKPRPSSEWRTRLIQSEADLHAAPDATVMGDPANATGLEVLSVLNHGVSGTKPATVKGVLALLREIETGGATRLGFGAPLQAEAQRVATALLKAAQSGTKREGFDMAAFGKGLDPAAMADEDLALARTLDQFLTYDPADPLLSLQYGLKKRPKAAVALEFQQVPGLAEEFMAQRFMPFEERIIAPQLRQAFNFVFGKRSNEALAGAVRQTFVNRASAQGVDATIAEALWKRWKAEAKASREPELRKGATGARRYLPGDNPLYADVRNIPNRRMDAWAHEEIDGLVDAKKITPEYGEQLHQLDYAALFREASSTVRRTLADSKVPLGKALADMYGKVVHNHWTTTAYYWFRFGLDLRFHAMNYFEPQMLYLGRAGFRRGEIDEGLLGQTEGHLRQMADETVSNTGYPFNRSRFAYMYRTFLKEQPDALRGRLKGLQTENPELMERALRELAEFDPQLREMIRHPEVGNGNADSYMRAMDSWYQKMMNTVDDAEGAATIDEAIAAEIRQQPALAEVYGRLAQVNKDLWTDIRSTFLGNPDRSRVERMMNQWILFWPLSYQIKATKWMARVLFDRAGGLPTNAGGAVLLDRFAQTHQTLMETDPEYADWYEKHETLMFASQMLLPITPTSVGVTMNPVLRNALFDRHKAVFEMGPIYTVGLLRDTLEEVNTDIYPTLKDLPVMNRVYESIYGTLTGREVPTP